MKRFQPVVLGIFVAAACGAAPLTIAQDFDSVIIKTEEVGNGVYMLQGAGGNIGMSVGPDGVFLIDDQSLEVVQAARPT